MKICNYIPSSSSSLSICNQSPNRQIYQVTIDPWFQIGNCKIQSGEKKPDFNLQSLISWLNSVVVIRHGLTPTRTLWVYIMYIILCLYQIQLTSHRFSVSNAQKREPRPPSVDSMLLPARSQKWEAPSLSQPASQTGKKGESRAILRGKWHMVYISFLCKIHHLPFAPSKN